MLAIAGTIGFAGCGGDDEADPVVSSEESGASGATGASGAALLPADFISEGDAICSEGDGEVAAAAEEALGADPSPQDQQAFVEDVVVPNIQGQFDELAELDPPDEGAEAFESLIDDGNAAIDELEANPEVLFSGENPFADVNKQAQALGFEDCGDDG